MVLMAAPAKITPSLVLVRTGSQTVLNFQKFENRELEPSVLSCLVRPVPVLRSSSEQNFGNTKKDGVNDGCRKERIIMKSARRGGHITGVIVCTCACVDAYIDKQNL